MPQKLIRKEAETLKAALANGSPTDAETALAMRALAPHISRTAHALQRKRAERRSLRLQALALAGCSAVFAALACLGYLFRAFLLAKPERWGPILGFGVLAVLVVCCLPAMIKEEEKVK